MPFDISVIVPIYNVSAYIEECLANLFEQQFDGRLELIFIDDCSTDSSAELCKALIAGRSNCSLIQHQINQGCSAARNTGLDIAKGSYIAFVDPDDKLPNYAFQALYNAAKTHHADIVKGNNSVFNDLKNYGAGQNSSKLRLIKQQDILSSLLDHELVRGHPWGKLFKRSCIGTTRFALEVKMAEDLLFCAEIFAKAQTLAIIPETVYHYRLHTQGSTGTKYQTGAYLWWLFAVDACSKFAISKQQLRSNKKLQVRTLLQLAREANKLEQSVKKDIKTELEKRVQDWNIKLCILLFQYRLNLASIAHYLNFKRALKNLSS